MKSRRLQDENGVIFKGSSSGFSACCAAYGITLDCLSHIIKVYRKGEVSLN